MPFPTDPLGTLIEFNLGGTWTDVTPKCRLTDPVTITRGRGDESARVDVSKCRFTINNKDGQFSPDNPMSPYYGQIGTNTPVRVSVHAGSNLLWLTGGTDRARATDTAALRLTGDLDIRFEAQLDDWSGVPFALDLVGRWGTPSNKSWRVIVFQGRVWFYWTTDGSTDILKQSTAPLMVPPSGRIAIRVTLDVNNGASGNTVTFYTSDSINGTWTQLGNPVVTAGTTSVFAGTALTDVGAISNSNFIDPSGSFYAFQLRNGINGPAVANIDFTAQTKGATSFVDTSGITWTLDGGALLTNRRRRFVGEIPSWPSEWAPNGGNAYVVLEATGIQRRLGQGAKPLDSTLRRRIPSEPTLVAYWPMEEGATATQAYSPMPGVRPLKTSGITYGQDDSLAGSSALASVSGLGSLTGTVPAPASPQTSWQGEFIFFLQAGPSTARTVMYYETTGTIRTWRLMVDSGGAQIHAYDSDGTEILNQGVLTTTIYNRWTRWRFTATQNGSNVDWLSLWIPIGGSGGQVNGSLAGTAGRVTGVHGPPGGGYSADLDGMRLGHISVCSPAGSLIYNSANTGFNGDTAGGRMSRLSSEQKIPVTVYGDTSLQEKVGPQRPDVFLTLLQDAADVDGGILYEPRRTLGLAYRDRRSLYNQPVKLALDYKGTGHIAPPLRPKPDDQGVRNDITVQRTGGSSGRATLDTGPLSTQDPPAGIGLYDDSIQLNLFSDDQPDQHAGWRLHLATSGKPRFPEVTLLLHKATDLIDAASGMDIGDRFTIANPPPFIPPGTIDQLMQSYTEVLHERSWKMTLNGTRAAPWDVAVTDDPVRARVNTAGSQLASSVTSSATALSVATTSGPAWTLDPAHVPFDVQVGGEVMTVTRVMGAVHDTYGRTVSGGWGTTDTGQAWTTNGGSGSDYSVTSGTGRASMGSVNVSRWTTVPWASADLDTIASMATDKLATGGSHFLHLVGRFADVNNCYLARLDFSTTQTVTLTLRKRVGGTETLLATAPDVGLVHAAGRQFWVRLTITGSTLSAKTWQDGTPEPYMPWQVTVTDTSLTAAGAIGTRSILSTSNTNTLPVVASYDGFQQFAPQTMTVVRSVNGVVKAQTSGTPVTVATAATAAL
ncbi:hypothetical protein ABZ883_14940 [Streptomyces sp. NPDC046977]|uniref:hypothetical protein n=1 Tax=Streptomyces sp. NPDC046977 TaxID=3154703 RepID=UPI0033C287E0